MPHCNIGRPTPKSIYADHPIPLTSSAPQLQGCYLVEFLNTLLVLLLSLFTAPASPIMSDHSGTTEEQLLGSNEWCSEWSIHLQVMWEANCSCEAAGYPKGSLAELKATWGDGSTCSGLPSPMDVPVMSQAAARESAFEVLRALRLLAGRVWPDLPAAAAANGGCSRMHAASYADWELLQDELLAPLSGGPAAAASEEDASLPAAFSSGCSWGEALWCCNPFCTNLEGPSELALQTSPCGGGCGVRYCSQECQARGWRDGHQLSCGRLRDRRAAYAPRGS